MKKHLLLLFSPLLLALCVVACSDAGNDTDIIPEEEVTDPEPEEEEQEETEPEPEPEPEPETPNIVYGDGPTNTLPSLVDLNNGWTLAWNDEFDYSSMDDFDQVWTRLEWQSSSLLGGRYKENVDVVNGVLYLNAKKESRDGYEWTSGNVCTKKTDFKFGFYEARMKYAAASGLNNAFWLWNDMSYEYPYEIDINEGHYPNIINTNQHYRWYPDGDTTQDRVNESYTQMHYVGTDIPVNPYASHTYDTPIKATKIRFTSEDPYIFTVAEFRVYAPNDGGYPTTWVASSKDFNSSGFPGLNNLAITKNPTITSCDCYTANGTSYPVDNAFDGTISKTWKPADIEEKWFELDFGEEVEIGHIQLLSGWWSSAINAWCKMLGQYKIEYYDGTEWHTASEFDNSLGFKLSDGFHNYGLYWDEERIIYYYDGEPIREIDFYGGECYWNGANQPMLSDQTIYLSLAVLNSCIGGVVTDKIDGTSQQIDWVRVYQKTE